MQLSYTCRLLCLALCSAGFIQLLMESVAWVATPLLLAHSAANPRRTERLLFLLALFAQVSPWLVALGAWVPAYVIGEDNLSRERVGWLCITGAICVTAWALLCLLRALRAWVSTQRCCNSCSQAGTTPGGLPMIFHHGESPMLAVAGLFRPRIIVSRSLLKSRDLSPQALRIALMHEGAHARHHDNLKLAVLKLLPHFSFASCRRPSIYQQWRLAAEIAADEDSVMGNPESSILLAELLVTVARNGSQLPPQGVFALLSRPEDLRIRVERLLAARPLNMRSEQGTVLNRLNSHGICTFSAGIALLAVLSSLGWEFGHRIAEVILHAG